MTDTASDVEDAWRACAPRVFGALVRRCGRFDVAEDALQDALMAATKQWPADGRPDDLAAWLIRVASRRIVDRHRTDTARARRELGDEFRCRPVGHVSDQDDTLALMMLCCHPSLRPPSQVALTLRAVAGLSTAQIARSFLAPEATMAQRIVRPKSTLATIVDPFASPARRDMPTRVAAVAHVLYLVFTEGHAATTGGDLTDPSLGAEAIRLAREFHRSLPTDGEVTGLLALMLLTDARRPTRTAADGAFVPLAAQDRTRWNAAQIAEGVALVERILLIGPVGPYQPQATIAAIHDEPPRPMRPTGHRFFCSTTCSSASLPGRW